jgi:hypothetical protein
VGIEGLRYCYLKNTQIAERWFVKKIPWLSLILLLASYSTFSWFLYRSTVTWIVWLAVLVLALLQALLLTALSEGFRRFMGNWLKSDVGYFTMIILAAFSVVIALVWVHVFEYVLMVFAAEILARMDLQNAGYTRFQALAILTVLSLCGLAVGLTADYAT